MGRWKRGVLLGGSLVVILGIAGVAAAFTSSDWEPRATKWENTACTEALLKSTESVANNQKIALCYALDELQGDKAAIAGLQKQQPENITFFNSETATYSHVVNLGRYREVIFSFGGQSEPYLFVEQSNDQTNWVETECSRANREASRAPYQQGTWICPVTGTYVRLHNPENRNVMAIAHARTEG